MKAESMTRRFERRKSQNVASLEFEANQNNVLAPTDHCKREEREVKSYFLSFRLDEVDVRDSPIPRAGVPDGHPGSVVRLGQEAQVVSTGRQKLTRGQEDIRVSADGTKLTGEYTPELLLLGLFTVLPLRPRLRPDLHC